MSLIATTRTLIAIGVHHNLNIIHCDIPQAFIQAPLDRDIWFKFPPGIDIKSEVIDRIKRDNPDATVAVKLLKSLYGLRQAAFTWSKVLFEFLESLGFVQSKSDPCLFRYEDETGKWVLLTTCTDDILITGTHTDKINEFCRTPSLAFYISPPGKSSGTFPEHVRNMFQKQP